MQGKRWHCHQPRAFEKFEPGGNWERAFGGLWFGQQQLNKMGWIQHLQPNPLPRQEAAQEPQANLQILR